MSNQFEVGDYVIGSPDADPGLFDGDTFKIQSFSRNLLGMRIVRLENITTGLPATLYPHELSWEDGSRPS